VTFLFTDIEGSTRLWQSAPDAMPAALDRHDLIVRSAIEDHDGYVFSTGGDGFAAAFSRAGAAVAAALEAQRGLTAESWPQDAPIRVRMGLHTGEVTERDGDYFGTPVNQAARLMAVGHGGQVLCSQVTAGLVGEDVQLVDLGEHRLQDLSAAQRVFQVGEGRFPALRSVDAVPGNLPTMRTELVGRTEQIADLVALLERERLVTLTGVGGVGKTSMALAVAGLSTGSFPDGCWFAELAPVSTGDEVVRAVSAAMGVSATDLTGLARFLSDRRALIVVDNCEGVLAGVAGLVEAVLAAGPEVAIVATSQAPLRVRGEVVREVASLAVPGPDASAAEALAVSAVGLFAARAAAASQRFVLDDTNVDAVVEICSRLDGIPLAIELAAARVRGMSVAEIARRLNERFRLLTTGGGAVDRQRTLYGAVSWSHDLLSDDERVVFRRLAAFPASFDLAAAEAVAAADQPMDVVDCVLRLVDRSLVVYDPAVDRYRVGETLRQYAADRLAEAGELDIVRDGHAQFYLGLAERGASEQDGPSFATFRRFDTEIDNLRAVADWLGRKGQWAALLGLSRNLFLFVWTRAPLEGYGWYRNAVEHQPDLDPQQRIDALGELDILRMACGEASDGDLAGASIPMADRLGLLHSSWACEARIFELMDAGDFGGARRAAELARDVAEERGDRFAAINALGILATVLASLGELDQCADAAAETLRRARQLPHPHVLALAVTTAAASYLSTRADPDFEAGFGYSKRTRSMRRRPDRSARCTSTGCGASPISDSAASPGLSSDSRPLSE